MSSSEQNAERLLASKVSIHEHVVFRAFAQETVELNLLTDPQTSGGLLVVL